MSRYLILVPYIVVLAAASAPSWAADDEIVELIVGLLNEKDKELRSVGLEQVRTEAKGAANTVKFAALLPKLPPENQAGLVSALADRGDPAALPGIQELLKESKAEQVRIAAIKAVGKLGSEDQLPSLVQIAASPSETERAAARDALVHLGGDKTSAKLAAEAGKGTPEARAFLIEVLATRRAADQAPELLPGALDPDPLVRYATMAALGQLARPEHLPTMLRGVLKATAGQERDAAEKAVIAVCGRIENEGERAAPLLATMKEFGNDNQLDLLPLVGKVGGAAALAALEADLESSDPDRRAVALEAICQWPDAAIADKLQALAKAATDDYDRELAFYAFVRVGALRDKRTEAERLERVRQAMALAKSVEEKKSVLRAARNAYLVESLRYVLPYLDQPEFQQIAAETIVELAHHRAVREPNKAEFDPALDRVLTLSTDETVKERARRYKAGQTWLRPERAAPKFDPVAARALQAEEEAAAKEREQQAAANNGLYIAAGVAAFLAVAAGAYWALRRPAPSEPGLR